MRKGQTRRFYYQPQLVRGVNEAYFDEDSPYPHVAVLEIVISMGAEEALAYLSSGCRELIRSVAIHEDSHGEPSVEVVLQEAFCPACKESRQHVLMIDEIAADRDPESAAAASAVAGRAALELRQAHIRFDGVPEYSWAACAPSRVMLSCRLCGARYYADWPAEDLARRMPSTLRFLDVASDGRRVILTTEGEAGTYMAVLDGRSGFATVGNRTLFKRATPIWDWGLLETKRDTEQYALFASALSNPSVYEYVQGLLPPDARMPGGLTAAGGPDCADPFIFLVCANRFRGYPAGFYEHVGSLRITQAECAYSGLNILPVVYSAHAMESVYSLLPLPAGQKRLRRDVFQNPQKVRVLANISDLPFSDPNVLHELLSSPLCDRLLAVLSSIGNGVPDIWFFLTAVFTDAAVFGFLKKISGRFGSNGFPDVEELRIDAARFDPAIIERLRRCRISDVFENASALSAISEGDAAGGDVFERIEYSPSQMGLEGSIGSFRFALPERNLHLHAAGQEMRNCLGMYAGHVGLGREAIVLVYDTSRPAKRPSILEILGLPCNPGRLVAAIRVERDCRRVLEAHAPCNEDIPGKGALADAYRSWEKRWLFGGARGA